MKRHTPSTDAEARLWPLVVRLAFFALACGAAGFGLIAARPDPNDLRIPVEGVTTAELRDSFHDPRGEGRTHLAIDIMAPEGAPVVASAGGVIRRLHRSPRGGIAVYQWDPVTRRCYFYGHLSSYAPGLREGDTIRRGYLLGFVGSTGNARADAPHLHFAVYDVGDEERCSAGEPVNPFTLFAGS